jgi:hypothetical protein
MTWVDENKVIMGLEVLDITDVFSSSLLMSIFGF